MYRPLFGNPSPWLDVEAMIGELTQDFSTAFNNGKL
jgi:hypothetical protein